MQRTLLLTITLSLVGISLFSCKRTQNCECKTTWVTYEPGYQVDHEETTAFPVKGTKNENKTQCDIIKTNQPNSDGYYTSCSIKK